jgi:hypothetical protein
MLRISTKAKAGLGAGLTLLVLTSCGSGGPTLAAGLDGQGQLVVGFPRTTEGAARVHKGDTVTIGSMVICLDKAGSVTINDVTAVGAVGLEQTGWAIRPNPSWQPSPTTGRGQLGVARRSLAQLEFPDSHVVDQKCGQGPESYEVGVQVQKTTTGEAGLHAVKVTYTSNGDTKTYVFNLGVRLCNEAKSWAKACHALKI